MGEFVFFPDELVFRQVPRRDSLPLQGTCDTRPGHQVD